jgi:hypothetical protein
MSARSGTTSDRPTGGARALAAAALAWAALVPAACGPRAPDRRAAGESCRRDAECEDDLVCVVAGTCLRTCDTDGDCGEGDEVACAPVHAVADAQRSTPLNACARRFALPAGATGHHGPTVARIPEGGGAVAVDLPALAAVSVVSFDAGEADLRVSRWTSLGEPAAVLFDAAALDEPSVLAGVYRRTLLLPDGPAFPDLGGGSRVELTADRAADVTATTVTRAPGPDGPRRLDVHLFAVDADAASAPIVAVALSRALAILAPAGIALGAVTEHAVPADLAAQHVVLERSTDRGDASRALEDLLALGAGAAGPAVDLFLVRTIDGALGLSGDAPGAVGQHGHRAWGIAVAAGVVTGEELLAQVIAHEIAHQLGLQHTSEPDGRVRDPLPDTPACRPDRDADGDGVLRPDECADAGAENLMFWTTETGGNIALTEEQANVLASSPVLGD